MWVLGGEDVEQGHATVEPSQSALAAKQLPTIEPEFILNYANRCICTTPIVLRLPVNLDVGAV